MASLRLISRRILATFLACTAIGSIATGGGVHAQDMFWTAPSTNRAAMAPNAMPAPLATATPPPAATPAARLPAALLSEAQLDQLVAPIALYPDPLLAQVLMASTYPLEVVEAARWVGTPANRGLTGTVLTAALSADNWDPSVKALVPFPRVLQTMSNQVQWTEDLGNAFLAQQADVMAAVQRLRQQAMAAGNLRQTPQCRCVIRTSGTTISILPSAPQVVCAPSYSPAVYGAWPYPAYPPFYFPIPVGFAFAPGFWIGFGPPTELAVFGPFWGWGRIDWGHYDIVVDRRAYVLAAGGRVAFSGSVWAHDPAHRGGVAYADAASRARFNSARVAAVAARARSGAAGTAMAARRGGARFDTARGRAAPGRAGGLGAAAGAPGSGVSHSAAAFHGGRAFHGGTPSHGASAFRGGSPFHGASHSGGGPRFAAGGAHGVGPRGGGSHDGGGPHFAAGESHGAGGGRHG